MSPEDSDTKDLDQKDLIRRSAIFYGAKPAVVCKDQRLSFREVDERANRLANGLKDLRVLSGMKVATLAGNCLQYAEIEFGLIKGALPQLTLNPRLKGHELVFQINDAEADVLLFQHHYLETVESIRHALTTVKHFISFEGQAHGCLDYEQLLSSASPEEPDLKLPLNKLGELRYTSGTTGSPKGIMLPYRSKAAVTRNLLLDVLPHLTSEDRWLAVQPLYHGAGWFMLPVWTKGITQFVVRDYEPQTVFEVIAKERITAIKTIPTLILRLLDSPLRKKYDIRSLHTIIYGGEPMPISKLKEAMEVYEKLMEKYPDKNDYYLRKISEIKSNIDPPAAD